MGNNQGSGDVLAGKKKNTEEKSPFAPATETGAPVNLKPGTPVANSKVIDVKPVEGSLVDPSPKKSGIQESQVVVNGEAGLENSEGRAKTEGNIQESNFEEKRIKYERAEQKLIMNSVAFCTMILKEDLEKNSNFMSEFAEHDLLVDKVTSQPNMKTLFESHIDPGELVQPQVSLQQLKTDSMQGSAAFDSSKVKTSNPFGTFSGDAKKFNDQKELFSKFSAPLEVDANQANDPHFSQVIQVPTNKIQTPKSELSNRTSNFGGGDSNFKNIQSGLLELPLASMRFTDNKKLEESKGDHHLSKPAVGQPFLKRSSNKHSGAELPPLHVQLPIPKDRNLAADSSMQSDRPLEENLKFLSVPRNEIGHTNPDGTHGKRNFMDSAAISERSIADVKMTDHYLDHMPVIKIDVHKLFREKSPCNEKLKRFVDIEQPMSSEKLFKKLKEKKEKKASPQKSISPIKNRPFSRYEVETSLSSARYHTKYENTMANSGKWTFPRFNSVKKTHHSTVLNTNTKADYEHIHKELREREIREATKRFEMMFGGDNKAKKTPEKHIRQIYKEISHRNPTPERNYFNAKRSPAADKVAVIDLRQPNSRVKTPHRMASTAREAHTPRRSDHLNSYLTETPNSKRIKVDIDKLCQTAMTNMCYPRPHNY